MHKICIWGLAPIATTAACASALATSASSRRSSAFIIIDGMIFLTNSFFFVPLPFLYLLSSNYSNPLCCPVCLSIDLCVTGLHLQTQQVLAAMKQTILPTLSHLSREPLYSFTQMSTLQSLTDIITPIHWPEHVVCFIFSTIII